jgi:hypothetical protein
MPAKGLSGNALVVANLAGSKLGRESSGVSPGGASCPMGGQAPWGSPRGGLNRNGGSPGCPVRAKPWF